MLLSVGAVISQIGFETDNLDQKHKKQTCFPLKISAAKMAGPVNLKFCH